MRSKRHLPICFIKVLRKGPRFPKRLSERISHEKLPSWYTCHIVLFPVTTLYKNARILATYKTNKTSIFECVKTFVVILLCCEKQRNNFFRCECLKLRDADCNPVIRYLIIENVFAQLAFSLRFVKLTNAFFRLRGL